MLKTLDSLRRLHINTLTLFSFQTQFVQVHLTLREELSCFGTEGFDIFEIETFYIVTFRRVVCQIVHII